LSFRFELAGTAQRIGAWFAPDRYGVVRIVRAERCAITTESPDLIKVGAALETGSLHLDATRDKDGHLVELTAPTSEVGAILDRPDLLVTERWVREECARDEAERAEQARRWKQFREQAQFPSRWWILPGQVFGGTRGGDFSPTGSFWGAEVSLVRNEGGPFAIGPWYGAMLDGSWNFGTSALRLDLGPEGGWGPIGVEAGVLAELRGGVVRAGAAGGLVVTLGAASVYWRAGGVAGDPRDPIRLDAGLASKIPFGL
jgi:hypothetical protein